MASEPTGRRKLAAILMADVAEYGRHMGEDEQGTIREVFAQTNGHMGFRNRHQLPSTPENAILTQPVL